MLTIMGILTILLVVLLLVWGKVHNIIVFSVVPFLMALIVMNFDLAAVGQMVSEGIGAMGGIASLFVFSMLFFNIMADAGVFDVIIKRLLKNSHNNVVKVCFLTAVISLISHLDGVGTTTIVVTTGAMLPIYKRLEMRPEVLLVIMFMITAAFGFLPWSAMMIYSGSVVNADPGVLFTELLPLQAVCFAVSILFIVLITLRENMRVKKRPAVHADAMEDTAENEGFSRGLLYFNIGLTLLVIAGLIFSVLPANYMFMLGSSAALLVNFRSTAQQTEILRKHGANIMMMVATVFAIGVFTSVLNETGMIEAMTNTFIAVMPQSLGAHFHVIIALLAVPLMFFLGNSPLVFALLPIVAGMTTQYGLGVTPAVAAILVGCNYGSGLSPSVAPLFMALSATELEYGPYLKYAFKWLCGAGVAVIIVACLFGIIPL